MLIVESFGLRRVPWLVSAFVWGVACLPCIAACSDDNAALASEPAQVTEADFVGTWVVTESTSQDDCGNAFRPPALGSVMEVTPLGDHILELSKDGLCDLELVVDGDKATLVQLPHICTNTAGGAEIKLTMSKYDYRLVDESHLTKSYTVDIMMTGESNQTSCHAVARVALSK